MLIVKELAEKGAGWAALHGITRFSEEEIQAILDAAQNADIKLMADTDSFEDFAAALDTPVISGEYINRSTQAFYPEDIVRNAGASCHRLR